VHEIEGMLEEQELAHRACDVLLMPPVDDDLTDEDSEDEEETLPKDPNHFGRGILMQVSEIQIQDKDDTLPDLVIEGGNIVEDEAAAVLQAGPSRSTRGQKRQSSTQGGRDQGQDKEDEPEEIVVEVDVDEDLNIQIQQQEAKKLPRVHNRDRVWKKTKPSTFGTSVPEFTPEPLKTLPDNCITPYDFFSLFLDDKFVEEMMTVSKLYCVKKNRPQVQAKLTPDNYRVQVAIMFLTGYLTPSNRKMYWENKEDTENLFVRNAMSKHTFNDIISNTYFVERVDPDPEDRFWKVRPLFNQLNKTAKKWVCQAKNVSVDEAIVKYFGPHPLKQFMKGKPHRFGYKVNLFYYFSKQNIKTFSLKNNFDFHLAN